MMKRIITKAALLLLLISGNAVAQHADLSNQYKETVENANNYQNYKVISAAKLSSLWRSVTDTFEKERKAIIAANAKILAQNQLIQELKSKLSAKDQHLMQSQAMIDQVSLLGMKVSKGAYSTIMWSLVIGLAFALNVISYRSVNFKKEAKYRISLFDELTEEFKTYKTKANEKQNKLARELQTERNRLDEIENAKVAMNS